MARSHNAARWGHRGKCTVVNSEVKLAVIYNKLPFFCKHDGGAFQEKEEDPLLKSNPSSLQDTVERIQGERERANEGEKNKKFERQKRRNAD